jgi:hypothetical protein
MISRRDLAEAFPGRPRLVRQFELQSKQIDEATNGLQTTAQATQAIQDATVITLSSNATFTNERVLQIGQGLSAVDDGNKLTIRTDQTVPLVNGGFTVNLVVSGTCVLVLPLSGTVATIANPETLTNKTLAAPKLSGLGDYADDSAAASGGVPVSGIYRTGSALKVRVS